MINMIQPLYVGNAVRLFLAPAAGAIAWRVLRKRGNAAFSGFDDPSANLVQDGSEDVFLDAVGLANDVLYYWAVFYTTDRVTWTAGNVVGATPTATYQDYTTDVMSNMRERLEAGLRVECDRGNFRTELGYIQVYTSPPLSEQGLRFPLVTLHMDSEDSADRAIGESISGDEFDAVGFEWQESEGWHANVRLMIVGWSLNGDERVELRKAIRRLIAANLPVFADYGWVTPNISQRDTEALSGEYSSPMYQSETTFTCVAPVRVGGAAPAITDVTATQIY